MSNSTGELERRFFDLSIDLLCMLDFNGYFKRLSPSWETTLGFTREELMSKPFIEFVHPDDRARTLEKNAEVRNGGQARLFENRYICRDGSFRWLRWNAAPDTSRRTIYSVARDVTEEKSLQDEVRTLQAILPICSYCKRVRDDENYWHSVEAYIAAHTNTRFSHGICPGCYQEMIERVVAESKAP